MRKHGFWMMVALAALAVSCLPARADDEKGRWSLGLGVGMLSTKDDIRNNAASLLLGERGVPNDISDDLVMNGSVDQRQDDLLTRDTEVEERQTFNLSAAYGLTSWLSLQVDLGYYSGNVGNFDTFRISRRFVDINGDNQLLTNTFPREDLSTPLHDASVPISAGRLQEIPISLSALFRFRKDSPFNPILGAGVGRIFTNFKESDASRDLNRLILQGFQRTQVQTTNSGLAAVNRQFIEDRFGNAIASSTCTGPANFGVPEVGLGPNPLAACTLGQEQLNQFLADPSVQSDPGLVAFLQQSLGRYINAEFLPQRPFVTMHVEDAFEYHFVGGAEYHFNDRLSAYVLGRYIFTSANLQIRISDNGNLVTPSASGDPSQAIRFQTDQARFRFLSASNCDVVKQTQATNQGQTQCLPQPDLLNDTIIVQGGKINLSGFTLGFGIRYTF